MRQTDAVTTAKSSRLSLTPGELNILADAEGDDVSIYWVLELLGLREGDVLPGNARPEAADIDLAFASITRLVDRRLITVGHFETPDGAETKDAIYVQESPASAKARVTAALAQANDDWTRACWVVQAGGADLKAVGEQASFERFTEEVDDFCNIPLRFAASHPDERANLLLHSLATLVALASDLPDISAPSHAAGALVSETERADIAGRLAEGFGGEVTFWTVEKPLLGARPGTTLARLAEDLADMWSVLVSGLRDLEAGVAPDDVYARWRSTYHSVWRTCAIRALGALHELDALSR